MITLVTSVYRKTNIFVTTVSTVTPPGGKWVNVVHLTFHLQTEKVVTFVSEIVFTQCINSLKIAIIVYRFIKNSAGMMLTNEIEQQWNYIQIRQTKKKKIKIFIFMFCT